MAMMATMKTRIRTSSHILTPWAIGTTLLTILGFYCGVLVGLELASSSSTSSSISNAAHADIVDHQIDSQGTTQHIQDEIERQVKERLELQRQSGKTLAKSLGHRFPITTEVYLHGAALINRTEFLDNFDVGLAREHRADDRNQHVYMLYQHKKALPDAHREEVVTNRGSMRILTVEEATKNCESLNVVSTKPPFGMHQCLAIVGQYESQHILRYMRIAKNQHIDSNLPLVRVGRGVDENGISDITPPPSRAQEGNWRQLIKYFTSSRDVRIDLKPLVENMTGVNAWYMAADNVKRPAVIVMVCNLGQADLLINFCCTARAKGLDLSRILVFCTDEETRDIAQALGLTAYYDRHNFKEIPAEEADTYGDKTFGDMMFIKAISVHLVSMLGYDVLFQDVDIVWNSNPLEYFENHYTDFDVILQDDGARSLRFAPYAGNTGFYYVRHNPRTKYLLTNMVYIGDQVRRASSHQQGMNIVLSEHAMLFGLKVKTMTGDNNFAGGFQYHRDAARMREIVDGKVTPMIFHMCWTQNRNNKLDFMQQMGMWQVKEACQSGPRAHEEWKADKTSFLETCCAPEPLVSCHFKDKPSIIPCPDSPMIDAKGRSFW